MRFLRLVLVGGLALTAPIAAQAGSLGSPIRPGAAGPAPGVVQVWDGVGPGSHPMPRGWDGDWRQVPSPSRQWNGGWVSPHYSIPNGPPSGWGPYSGPGVPTYWVWGPSGGAFDYPFADWRGPTGGWGNP
jgi:hypothetical protein